MLATANQRVCRIGLLFLVILPSSLTAFSQSGRRAAKLPQPPVAAAPANTDSVPANPSGELKRTTQLLVARQTTHKHFQTEDAVFASFVKRLGEFANVKTVPIGDMKQSQARARAKAENEAPVVILTFDIDSYAGGTIILNSQDLEIEYFLFAPQSGKKLTQGKLYFQGVGSGRLRKSDWPNGTPVKMTPEAAGIDAAESLHQWLLFAEATKKTP